MNLSDMDTDGADTKVRIGYQFGVLGEYNLPKSFFIESGLLLTSKGLKTEESGRWDINEDGFIDEGTLKSNWNALYLEIPVTAGYRVVVNDDFKISFNAGPYIAYGIGGKIAAEIDAYMYYPSGKEHVEDKDKTDTFSDISLKRFDLGLLGAVAGEYKKIKLSIGYEYGLLDISQGSNSVNTRNVFITLGYTIF